MANKQTIAELEEQNSLVVLGEIDTGKEVTEKEFADLVLANGSTGVMHKDRIAFLKANGYDITRENLVNPELGAKPKKGN